MPRGNTQFDRCVRGVTRSGSAVDPRAVCGAQRARRKGNPSADALNRQALEVKARLLEEQEKHDRKPTRASGQRVKSLRAKYSKLSRKYMAAVRRGNAPKKTAKTVRVLGRDVRPGTKKHAALVARQKHFDDLRAHEPQGRRNPLDGALKTYEGFHGRPSEEIVEVTTELHEHSHLAGIGDLVKLVILTDNGAKVIVQKFEDDRGNPAILCQNERPKHGEYKPQLFIEGGDQSVKLSDFGIFEPYHEMEVLGRLRNVYYYTRKDHLGADGGTATYNHKFGGTREVKGRGGKVRRKRSPLPTILYDTRNRLLSFAGGGYTIPDEGIDN